MAENSPLKRNRSSPQYHPYEKSGGSGRSPLQGINPPNHPNNNTLGIPRRVKPLPLPLVHNEKGFFSFSGGTSSLFPSSAPSQGQALKTHQSNDHRMALSQVSNLLPHHPQPAQPMEKGSDGHQAKAAFGIIGGNRRSTSSMGFIPVDQSCTIGGTCETEIIRFEQEQAKPKRFFKSENPWRTFKSQHGYLPSSLSSTNVGTSSSFSIFVDSPSPVTHNSHNAHNPYNNTSFKENDNSLNISSNKVQLSFPNPSCDVTTGVLAQLQPKGLNSSFTEKFVSRLGLDSGPNDNLSEDERVTNKEIKPLGERRGILTERFTCLFDYPEYYPNILKYWEQVERRIRPKHKYMNKQKEISYKMRSILIDWLAEVVIEYGMCEQTLHLAVNYIDRFLSKMNCLRTKLQLIGTTALLIASKFEEIHPPETSDFVYVTDEAFNKTQILQMETVMLSVLEFDLMVPTAHDFAAAYCSILQVEAPIRCLALYLVDLSLLEGETYLDYDPSIIATAAVILGRYNFEHVYWDDRIRKLQSHRQKTISACVKELVNTFFNAPEMQQGTIYDKYLSVTYCAISRAFIRSNGPWLDGWTE